MKQTALALSLWLSGITGFCQSDSIVLTEVQVSTNKVRNDISSTSPIHTLSHQNIISQGVTDIADALHRLPGITLRDYGGAGGMKTVSVRGFGVQHTGVSYDGIALSDCQTGQIDFQRYTLSSINSIQLMVGDNEEIFQPARNLSNAAMVGINTNSKQSVAQITCGAWGYVNPILAYCFNVNEKTSLSASADFIYAENNYGFTLENVSTSSYEHRNHSRMKQGHGEVNFKASGRRYSLTGKLYYYDNDRQLPGVVHYYVNDNDENLHEQNAFGQVQFRRLFSDKFSFLISGKWNWAMSDYKNEKPSGNINSASYWQREGYGSASLLYTPLTSLSFSYSADYIFNSLNGETYYEVKPYRHSILQAFCGKWTDRRLSVVGKCLVGIYNNNGTSETNVSPSASASYKLFKDKELFIRAGWKDGFRMPSFNELYYYHLGTPTLRPERAMQWNVGIAQNASSGAFHINYSADIYLNNIHDKIVSIPVNMFVWRNINIDKVLAYGTDICANLSYAINKQHSLELAFNYSYQRVRNNTDSESRYFGNQIAYTPEHSGSITLGWQNQLAHFSLTTDGMNERWTTNEHSEDTRLPGFMEWSASAYKQFNIGSHHFSAQASISNIFNCQYDIVARYPMPGRGWKFTLTYKF